MPSSKAQTDDLFKGIPILKKASQRTEQPSIPAALQLDPSDQKATQAHLDTLGLDEHNFPRTVQDQDHAYQICSELGVHFPEEMARDARSKLVIRHSESKVLANPTRSM
ncbi:hypothetical protein PLEOSDRAFT_158865 [Pleurotus ostreatus PC15]|uniref:Uncharacterized protein n=1 Tax=Pleurotus ostreatus (strain PC15) TaxID=1137138 RepID=A0A067NH93_PLEO1|nr:hypothetical protein PLEOSDRAFT_158865 [Pleurotus ostreatus PC15]